MKLYELKSGQKFKLLNLDEVFTFEKVDGMYARIITPKGEIDFIVMNDGEKSYYQVAYLLADEKVIDREFGAYESVRDNFPKYVLSMDKLDFSRDGIVHKNILDFLLED